MTILTQDMPVAAGSRRPALAGPRDRTQAFARAARHSRWVRRLKIALPVLAAAVGGLYFMSSGLSFDAGGVHGEIERIDVSQDGLRMVHPRLEGADGKHGKYLIRADYAQQSVETPDIATLHTITADLNDAARGWSKLTAPRGVYNSKTEHLELLDDIQLKTQTGLQAKLTQADIDLKDQTIASSQPVDVAMPTGTVRADTLHIETGSSIITFDRNVAVHMKGKPEEASNAAPANGPPAVAVPVQAAQAQNAVAGMAIDRTKPVDVTADTLTVHDKDKHAVFDGNVVVSQTGYTMTAKTLELDYAGGPAGDAAKDAKDTGGTEIKAMRAKSNVHVAFADGRTATGDWLTYDAAKQRATLGGGVRIGQAASLLTGSAVTMNMANGTGAFAQGQRISGHFETADAETTPVAQEAPGAAKAADATTTRDALNNFAAAAVKEAGRAVSASAGKIDLTSTRGKPIDIESDGLSFTQSPRNAVFTGNVVATQGDMTLRSRQVEVDFAAEGDEAAAKTDDAGKPGSDIETINARDRVLITTGDGQTVTGDWAIFEAKNQLATIGGHVVLSRDGSVIEGDKLIIDMTNGRSHLETTATPASRGRVKMLAFPGRLKKKAAEKKDAEKKDAGGATRP